jgi:hypothetical protein
VQPYSWPNTRDAGSVTLDRELVNGEVPDAATLKR